MSAIRYTAQTMPEKGFPLTRIQSYKDRDSGFTREYAGQGKPIFWHILRSDKT